MSDQSEQVKALQKAIIQRARELAEEHVNQGKLIRSKIMQDARDKVQIMEKKELLATKDHADREYKRLVQASELRMQAELDRNRWGLVQSVMDQVGQKVAALSEQRDVYEPILYRMLEKGVEDIKLPRLIASINSRDHPYMEEKWEQFVSGLDAEITLSSKHCECSGGVRLYSEDGSTMVDNTFEGIIKRRQDELMRLVFERLFSQLLAVGVPSHG